MCRIQCVVCFGQCFFYLWGEIVVDGFGQLFGLFECGVECCQCVVYVLFDLFEWYFVEFFSDVGNLFFDVVCWVVSGWEYIGVVVFMYVEMWWGFVVIGCVDEVEVYELLVCQQVCVF